ncbi:MAG: HAD family hydrolase [Pseudomonadota bacterium]
MSKPAVTRIAMWSGPRNLSTAMMRSWENRADTAVIDEPFYACFLTHSGIRHPMQEEVLASQPHDWQAVIQQDLSGELGPGQNIQYQKQMTHHMISEIDQAWFASLRHAFLIRHPADVVSSYSEKRESVNADDIGFRKQKVLYDLAVMLGDTPPVIDAADVLKNPRDCLSQLCIHLGVEFDENMLHWPAGPRESDGAWAPHWYHNVEKSTGFAPFKKKQVSLSQQEQAVVDECLPYYEAMYEQRIQVNEA